VSNTQKLNPAVDGAVKPSGPDGFVAEQLPVAIEKRSPSGKGTASGRDLPSNAMVAGEARPADTLTKAPLADDSSTQVSSSDSSANLPGFDKQSIASGTTFALDEKESLRPDDSASIRATEEEDVFSGSGTGAAGSRVGSDTDARAFSEQLHQIYVMAPRGGPAIMRANISFGEVPMNIVAPQPQALSGNGVASVLAPTSAALSPDEKLLEALESPRDRVYVLKIEQDILDFLKNDK